jgi:Fe-S cluster assembly protein SufB
MMTVEDLDLGKYKLGWHDSTSDYVYAPKKGLNEEVVRDISAHKDEPEWMTKFRLASLKRFERKPMLDWFAKNMPDMDFDDIYYYHKPTEGQVSEWDELPEAMQATYEKLGIPEAERKFLAGVTAQYDSETVYHRNRDELAATGVLFTDMDTAVREYPEIVQQYLGTVIPPGDNKFAALNSSVWSGGSFIYVPPGVHVEMPLFMSGIVNAPVVTTFATAEPDTVPIMALATTAALAGPPVRCPVSEIARSMKKRPAPERIKSAPKMMNSRM